MKAFTLWTRKVEYERDHDGTIWCVTPPVGSMWLGCSLAESYCGTTCHGSYPGKNHNFRRYPYKYLIT